MDLTSGQQLLVGFSVALRPENLMFAFIGVLLGTMIGVLPGIGPAGAIAALLPFTFGMDPTTSLIMLAGIFYGGMYGGSTTSILLNVPGEAASVVTTLDGHQMARSGRAGAALAISAIGSFVAGTVGVVLLTVVAAPLAMLAIRFGPPEYFALTVLGVMAAAYLSSASMLKGLAMVILGLMLSTVGIDLITGGARFTYGVLEVYGGVELVPVLIGLFGISEILSMLQDPDTGSLLRRKIPLRELWPSGRDLRDSAGPIARGSFLGFGMGMLPSGGPFISSFLSYALEKKISKRPETFGKGAIEGVAGPESANNSATAGSMVPLLILGIPFNVVTAIMLGALIIQGLQPSPMLMTRQPEFFWGVVASMYIGNVMCLVLNLPLVGIWVKILQIPVAKMIPMILLFCVIGVYSINARLFDLWLMLGVGILGYALRRLRFPLAPLVLALVLGRIMENALRQSLLMGLGSPLIFIERPMAAAFIFGVLGILTFAVVSRLRRRGGGAPALSVT